METPKTLPDCKVPFGFIFCAPEVPKLGCCIQLGGSPAPQNIGLQLWPPGQRPPARRQRETSGSGASPGRCSSNSVSPAAPSASINASRARARSSCGMSRFRGLRCSFLSAQRAPLCNQAVRSPRGRPLAVAASATEPSRATLKFRVRTHLVPPWWLVLPGCH